jgi:hypothetical protein
MEQIKIANNLKDGLMDALSLAASKQVQLDYQANAPIADVAAEIFAMWGDGYYPDLRFLDLVFSEKELKVLAEYEIKMNNVLKKLPRPIPYLEQFQTMPEWQELSAAAQTALNKLDALKLKP